MAMTDAQRQKAIDAIGDLVGGDIDYDDVSLYHLLELINANSRAVGSTLSDYASRIAMALAVRGEELEAEMTKESQPERSEEEDVVEE